MDSTRYRMTRGQSGGESDWGEVIEDASILHTVFALNRSYATEFGE